jgi:hypothetical protein
MIFEMWIGNRWPRPEQAAVGALDRLSVDQWPRLAAHWLAAGFDSEPLRQLAELQPWASQAALVLMPEVLRSIGSDPAASDEEFVARCQDALDLVQRTWTPPASAGTGYGHAWAWDGPRWCTRPWMASIGAAPKA